ncbi:MAG: agmatine deiminase family protein [Flavobacteriales bacterium]|nr:agmatine deiminase family protein [Flavobacteriales bacterium]
MTHADRPLGILRLVARLTATFALLMPLTTAAQQGLPHALDPSEVPLIRAYRDSRAQDARGTTTPPPFAPRTMAEWEEVQTLCVAWVSFPSILKQIVRHARAECQVLILCGNPGTTNSQTNITSYLLANNAGGAPLADLTNISFLNTPYNSIWMRDYGPECIYQNEVDSLFLLDWIYNRPRPADDATPDAIGAFKNIAVYSTTTAPNDLVHTGGNFMSDGFGTGFSSNLVVDENGPSGVYNQTDKTPAQVDALMTTWMGIQPGRYVRMTQLPFDGINHIDMHMKLLDERTLLIGQFPNGVSDGPQIEANIQFIQQNYSSVFGTPYRIIRVPMPPSTGGSYPPNSSYRTYTNSIFINRTILVPTYREQYDTTALRIYREALPGYTVVPIDCDDASGNIIAQSGALHCITKAIGVAKPLLIRHEPLADRTDDGNGYPVEAYIRHQSGIANAEVYWTTDTTQGYTALAMGPAGGNTWSATIPEQTGGGTVYYHLRAVANSGKVQVRPITAPQGWWRFTITPAPGFALAVRAYLEGAFDGNTGLMRDDLRTLGLLPLTEPCTAAGFVLVNNSTPATTAPVLAVTGTDAIVDWVLVELRDAATPSTVLRSRTALVQRDGDIVSVDGTSPVSFDLPAGSYHVAVRHRNHLGVMTAAPLAMGVGTTVLDLTAAATPTWGTEARKAIGGVRALWAGNVQRDDRLKYAGSANDRDPVLTAIGGTVPTATVNGQYRPEDMNMDGVVKYAGGGNDRDPILVNIGGTVPTATRIEQLP